MKPVACFIRPDLAPRGAVRKVGPRPDLTRSAPIDEPGGMAIRPGDRSQGFTVPSERRISQPVAGERRTAAAKPPPWGGHGGGGRLTQARRPFRFFGGYFLATEPPG